MTPQELARRARERRAAQTPQFSAADMAERARMNREAQAKLDNPELSPVRSMSPGEGLVYDPRTGGYVNRAALTQGYEPTRAESIVGGGMQGTALNWADEALGTAARAIEGPEYGPMRREQARGRLEAQQEAFPYSFGGAELAGNVTTALAGLPAATGTTMAGTATRGAGIGATEGFLYGTGQGEGLADRFDQGANAALVGLGLGAASPFLVAGGRKVLNTVGDAVVGGLDHLTGRTATGRAQRRVAEALAASGKSADDVTREIAEAVADGQPVYRVADALGDPGARGLSGIARGGNDRASQEITEFLEQRAADAKDRVLGFTDEAFDMRSKTRAATEAAVVENRKKVENALFEAAADDAGPVDVRGAVKILDGTIGQMTNSGIAPPRVVREFQKLRRKLAGRTPDGDPTRLSDYKSVLAIWREVRDNIDGFYKDSKGDIGEALKPVRDALRGALEESSDLYRSATDLSRVGRGVADAFETGAQAANRGRAADNIATYGKLTPQQQRAARVGYGDEVSASIERNKALQPNPAREFASTKRQAEAGAMAVDPELLARRLARENTMYDTTQRALRGSQTSTNQADQAAMGPLADLARAGRDTVSANFGQAITNAANAVAPYLTGQNEPTRQAIARILLSQDPQAALAPVLRQSSQNQTINRVAEALMRNQQRDNYLSPR